MKYTDEGGRELFGQRTAPSVTLKDAVRVSSVAPHAKWNRELLRDVAVLEVR